MLPASWPLASMSDLQIAYDWSLISWPYRRSVASGFCASRRSSATASMPPVPAVGSYIVRMVPGSVRRVVLCEQQVDHQSDRIARRVVLPGVLIGGLGELVDQVLERVTHLGVGHGVRVQVDLGERLHEVAQEPVFSKARISFSNLKYSNTSTLAVNR